jgi:hypothetical protein
MIFISCDNELDYPYPSSGIDGVASQITIEKLEFTSLETNHIVKFIANEGVGSVSKVTLDTSNVDYKTYNNAGNELAIPILDIKYKKVNDDKSIELLNTVPGKSSDARVYYVNKADGKERVKKFKLSHVDAVTDFSHPSKINTWDSSKVKVKLALNKNNLDADMIKVDMKYKLSAKSGNVPESVLKSDMGYLDSLNLEVYDAVFKGSVLEGGDTLFIKWIAKVEGVEKQSSDWVPINITNKDYNLESKFFSLYASQDVGGDDSVAYDLLSSQKFDSIKVKVQTQVDTSGVWQGHLNQLYFGSKIQVSPSDDIKFPSDYKELSSLVYATTSSPVDLYEDKAIAFRIIDSEGEFKYGVIKVVDIVDKKGDKDDMVKYEYRLGNLK